jgi:hypothetical protein
MILIPTFKNISRRKISSPGFTIKLDKNNINHVISAMRYCYSEITSVDIVEGYEDCLNFSPNNDEAIFVQYTKLCGPFESL